MTREEFLTAYHNQLTELLEIGKELKVTRDWYGLPSDALSFAETLLLCPTRQAAIEQMRRDPAATRSFLDIAVHQEQHITSIRTSGALKRLTATTPFFAVATGVQEYLSFLKSSVPDRWK